jgi:hypothetical protein
MQLLREAAFEQNNAEAARSLGDVLVEQRNVEDAKMAWAHAEKLGAVDEVKSRSGLLR